MGNPDQTRPRNRHWVAPLVRGRFFWLLISLVAFVLLSGETPATESGRWESIIPFMIILVGTTYAARAGRMLLLATILLNVIFLATLCWYFIAPAPAIFCIALAALLACLLIALFSTLGFVLGSGSVGADHILGAICAYVMIAMIYATVYAFQWAANPDGFSGMRHDSERPWAELFYFSFTTLSTVGYGDIVPTTLRTRSVVMVEQLTGTFYVAVLIARLAGLYPPPERGSGEG